MSTSARVRARVPEKQGLKPGCRHDVIDLFHVRARVPEKQGLKLYLVNSNAKHCIVRARVPEKQGLKLDTRRRLGPSTASPGASSRKTRIETRGEAGPRCANPVRARVPEKQGLKHYNKYIMAQRINVRARVPEKQGLKLWDRSQIRRALEVRARVPEKQGLKLLKAIPAKQAPPSPGASSRKTRIETQR